MIVFLQNDDSAEKLDRFAAVLLDLLQDSSGLEISMDHHFDCCDDPNMVIFRAQLLGQEPDQCDPSLGMIEEWVQGAPTVIILGNRLTVVSTNEVIINSFDDPASCPLSPAPITITEPETLNGGAIAGIVIAIIVVLVVAAVVVLIVVCFLLRRKSKRYYLLHTLYMHDLICDLICENNHFPHLFSFDHTIHGENVRPHLYGFIGPPI